MNLHGSATFDVVTTVIAELTVPWVVVPVLRNKFDNLPKEFTVPHPHSYPAEESSMLFSSVGEILPVYLELHLKRRQASLSFCQ